MAVFDSEKYPLAAEFVAEHDLSVVIDSDIAEDLRRLPRPHEVGDLDPVRRVKFKGADYQAMTIDYADVNFPEEVVLASRVFYVMQKNRRLELGFNVPGNGNMIFDVHSGAGEMICATPDTDDIVSIQHMRPSERPIVFAGRFFGVRNNASSPLVVSRFQPGDNLPPPDQTVIGFGPLDEEINIWGAPVPIPFGFRALFADR